MKRILISNEEKERILEMHVNATKRNYLSEQEGGDFPKTDSSDVNQRQELFRTSVNNITNKFGNTTKVLEEAKNLANSGNINGAIKNLKSLPDDLLIQLDLFKVPSTSGWQEYDSLLYNVKIKGNQPKVIEYMLADVVGLKKGLTELSAEKSGFRMPNYDQFSNWKVGDVKTFLNNINTTLGNLV